MTASDERRDRALTATLMHTGSIMLRTFALGGATRDRTPQGHEIRRSGTGERCAS